MSARWGALALAVLTACASGRSHRSSSTSSSGTHGARPIPRGSPVGPSGSAPQSRPSGHSGGNDSASICLGLLCDVGVCFAESAGEAVADDLARSESESDLAIAYPDAGPAPAPPEVALAAEVPHAGYFPPELPAAIEQAQVLLRSGNYEGFLARFLTREDREALARAPGRDPAVELGNGRADPLLRGLAICRESGVSVESGDRVTCVGTPERLTWRLEPQGWCIEGLAAAPPAPQPPVGDVPRAE